MSKPERLSISVSNQHGTSHLSIPRFKKRYVVLFLLIFCGLIGYASYSAFNLYSDVRQSRLELNQLKTEKSKLNVSLVNEKAVTQTLNQELAHKTQTIDDQNQKIDNQTQTLANLNQTIDNKKQTLDQLNARINDMESILGIKQDDIPQNLDQRLDNLAINAAIKMTLFQLIPNGSPTPNTKTTSGFGMRFHPIEKKHKPHNGLDFKAKIGTPIYAPADAVIERARKSNYGYGNQLTLNHTMGFTSSYSHMSKFDVKQGEFVTKGQLIGWTGNSGLSTGPHLHYEIRFLGKPLNPLPFVKWNITDYDSIFKQESNVKWASLLNTISDMVEKQVHLTGNEQGTSLATANHASLPQKKVN